ncbi:MAG: hypothetical protein JW925_10195, partial [Syntrophaceae bacterium]|nr:hypothetical protein [Syntrophaceae bacterium]
FDKVRPVRIGSEYLPPLYPPDDHMMQCSGCVKPHFSWHINLLTYSIHYVKLKSIDVPVSPPPEKSNIR